MDRDTVIALARESGLEILSLDGEDEVGCGDGYHIQTDLIERFAALVEKYLKEQGYRQCAKGQRTTQFCGILEQAVLAEREACAKVCDDYNDGRYANTADLCAAAIRSMK